MDIRGNIKIHKADGITKSVVRAKVIQDGCLAVWDEAIDGDPDIIVQSDKWERIEREGHSWRRSHSSNIIEEAKERDDVDVDQVREML